MRKVAQAVTFQDAAPPLIIKLSTRSVQAWAALSSAPINGRPNPNAVRIGRVAALVAPVTPVAHPKCFAVSYPPVFILVPGF
jgi:hypothetical protein